MIVAVGNDRQFERLCSILGLETLTTDERYRTNPARVVNRGQLIPLLEERILTRPSAGLAAQLDEAGIPAGPINSIDAVFADPHVVHRGMRLDLDGVPGLASPIVIDGKRQVSGSRSPKLGSGS
jgi:crotonobetainyl-CoA:carnitine CoA-transferase CaiB-like acyl-CoA transferase